MKTFFRSLSLGLGLSALFTGGNLNAAEGTRSMAIPFEFHAGRMVLHAGEYRLEQDSGDARVSIVNVKTGRRIQVMRDGSRSAEGRARLIFEPAGQGCRLIRVW